MNSVLQLNREDEEEGRHRFSTICCSNFENKASRGPEHNTYLEGKKFPSKFQIKETKNYLMVLYFIQNFAHTR
jgi:hypothetical protein